MFHKAVRDACFPKLCRWQCLTPLPLACLPQLWFYHRRTNPHTILPIGGSPPQDFGGQGSPVGEDLPMFWKPASDVAASDEAGSDGGDNAQGGEGGRPRVASGTADAATAAGAGEVPRRCRVDGEPWATRGRHVLYGFGDGVGDLADTLYGRSFPEPRYYFHARTAVPMLAGDLDEGRDSDDEDIDEEWEVGRGGGGRVLNVALSGSGETHRLICHFNRGGAAIILATEANFCGNFDRLQLN